MCELFKYSSNVNHDECVFHMKRSDLRGQNYVHIFFYFQAIYLVLEKQANQSLQCCWLHAGQHFHFQKRKTCRVFTLHLKLSLVVTDFLCNVLICTSITHNIMTTDN